MALKDLIVKRGAKVKTPRVVIDQTLQRYGVKAHKSVADGVVSALQREGIGFTKPRKR